LRERGARLQVAEVYARAPLRGGARRRAAFIADADGVLLVSSLEALGLLLAHLPDANTRNGERLRRRPLVASSARLAAMASTAGFARVITAEGPTPTALVAAVVRAAPVQ
jgi:uroporphyrinogen-III synthase